jgi:hypothetical protein
LQDEYQELHLISQAKPDSYLGFRPFSTEKEPLALSPGVSNPLKGKPKKEDI